MNGRIPRPFSSGQLICKVNMAGLPGQEHALKGWKIVYGLHVCETMSVHRAGLAPLPSTVERLEASMPLVPGSGSVVRLCNSIDGIEKCRYFALLSFLGSTSIHSQFWCCTDVRLQLGLLSIKIQFLLHVQAWISHMLDRDKREEQESRGKHSILSADIGLSLDHRYKLNVLRYTQQ